MTIHLTPEQERRLRAVLDRGAYKSVEEVVEAALTAVEQRTVPGFAGTPEELDTLLAEGLASKQLTEDELLSSVSKQTDALFAKDKTGPRSYRFCISRPPATTSYVSSATTYLLRMLPRSPLDLEGRCGRSI